MKFLKKTLKKPTKKPEGSCDRCQITIWEGDRALCFHGEGGELYICENCVEEVRREYVDENIL